MTDALVVGAGPAGLMAADQLASAGFSVIVADAMPSVGRKFLMAGKSGLNLTKDEDTPVFARSYAPAAPIQPMIDAFGPAEVKAWAGSLEQSVFTGSSGRVFPTNMKASPLLRAWLVRLNELGVEFKTRWRWQGGASFETADGPQHLNPKVTILALGGGSWARLGSDGRWTSLLDALGAQITPFKGSNVGYDVDWSKHMASHFGKPVKPVRLSQGGHSVKGEFVLTKHGVEGSAIYALSSKIDPTQPVMMDIVPDLSIKALNQKLAKPRGKASLSNYLRKTLGLNPVKLALLNELARPFPAQIKDFPFKALPLLVAQARPIDEAISTAGGVSWDCLDADLRLNASALPFFCAGEMLDWDAPTGGYLITGCLATGRWAGLAAVRLLQG